MCFQNKIVYCTMCQIIVTMGSKHKPTDKVHAAGSTFADFAAFHQRAISSISDALAELSWSYYTALALQAAPVCTQFTERNHLQTNSGSILNHAQALSAGIVGLRNAYALPRATSAPLMQSLIWFQIPSLSRMRLGRVMLRSWKESF